MKEKLEQILKELKELKIPISKVESELGFSNGLLGKAKKGETNLSEEKFDKLNSYYLNKKIPANVPPIEEEKNGHEKTSPIIEGTKLPKIDVKNNSEKRQKLMEDIAKINKDLGAGTVVCLTETPKEKLPSISTGSYILNDALGIGGLPRGRIVEIVGPESSGKTTLALNIIKEAQKKGGLCAIIDSEHAFDAEYAAKIGVDMNNIMVSQPDYGEQALESTDRLILTGKLDVIVFDSVAAIVPKAELEGEMGESKMGLIARLMSQALRKLTPSVSKTNCLLIFINQYRNTITNNPYQPSEVPTGGNALKYYASVRLDVRKSTQIKDGDFVIGNKVRVKVIKNKVAPPFRVAEYDFYYDSGIDNIGEIIEMATIKGIILKSGSWYSYNGSKIGQGKEQVRQLLSDNETLLEEIKNKILYITK